MVTAISSLLLTTLPMVGNCTTQDQDVPTCLDTSVAVWIARLGVPVTNELWDGFCRRLGILHNTTTAYHPPANGRLRAPHQLKDALRACLGGVKVAGPPPLGVNGPQVGTEKKTAVPFLSVTCVRSAPHIARPASVFFQANKRRHSWNSSV
jgi:hypothetical protein